MERIRNRLYLLIFVFAFYLQQWNEMNANPICSNITTPYYNYSTKCLHENEGVALDDGESSPVQEEKVYSDAESFFVITTIFNPVSYQSRYDLYFDFAKRMNDAGVQLITVECIFPELGQHEFKVTNPENPSHIQLESKSVFWMKENLINIAVSRLPAHAKWVAWIDADLEFEDNWVNLTIEKLKEYTVVQIFEKCNFLGPDSSVIRTDYSFGYSVVHGKLNKTQDKSWYAHPGFAWATSVSAFKLINGLPEFDILGSADLDFVYSLINRDKESSAMKMHLSESFKDILRKTGSETYKQLRKLNTKGNQSSVSIGYVPITLNHIWHGSRNNRQYDQRWIILVAHQFDPLKDLRKTDEGLLEFVPGQESLQKDILEYFKGRNEDAKINEEETSTIVAHYNRIQKRDLGSFYDWNRFWGSMARPMAPMQMSIMPLPMCNPSNNFCGVAPTMCTYNNMYCGRVPVVPANYLNPAVGYGYGY